MSRIAAGLILLAAPALGLADVVTLECTGTSPKGTKQTLTIKFDEKEGWVDDGSFKMRDGVAAYFLTGIKVFIDRQTGDYETRQSTAGEKFKGKCKPTSPTQTLARS
jgi:hypothetical protein